MYKIIAACKSLTCSSAIAPFGCNQVPEAGRAWEHAIRPGNAVCHRVLWWLCRWHGVWCVPAQLKWHGCGTAGNISHIQVGLSTGLVSWSASQLCCSCCCLLFNLLAASTSRKPQHVWIEPMPARSVTWVISALCRPTCALLQGPWWCAGLLLFPGPQS